MGYYSHNGKINFWQSTRADSTRKINHKDYANQYPQRLKDLRLQHNKSQQQVAGFLGMAPGQSGHYETGRAEPGIPILVSLARYFDTTIDELLGVAELREKHKEGIIMAYHSVDAEKRKIVDFILKLG